jgi:hypothetical protein
MTAPRHLTAPNPAADYTSPAQGAKAPRRQLHGMLPCARRFRSPSLHLSESPDGTLLWKCFAGCPQDAVQRELERLAGVQPATARPIPPRRRGRTQQQAVSSDARARTPLGVRAQSTLAEYARAKGLDAERLRAWGLTDLQAGGIEIPYRNADGEIACIRYRLALEGANRFRWRQGDTPMPVWAVATGRVDGQRHAVPVRGRNRYPQRCGMQGCPRWGSLAQPRGVRRGGARWRRSPESWRFLTPTKQVLSWRRKLQATCPLELTERVYVLQLPEGVKDANELWQREGANAERFRNALAECATFSLSHFLTLNTPEKVRNWQAEPIDLAEATPRPVEWLVRDLIPRPTRNQPLRRLWHRKKPNRPLPRAVCD